MGAFKLKKVIFILLFCIILISSGCSQNESNKYNNGSTSQIANPSATKCIEDGFEYEIRYNDDASQTGYCIYNDNECEEWAYYRGECNLT